ncbi:MAG: GNAT family N-acetyltransferase [Pyrinomonadaceae bacterium]|jgi:aminoglycoside 6'-N-acetyltransferase I
MASDQIAIRIVTESDLNEWLRLRKLLWDENADEDHRNEMFEIIGHGDTQLVAVADAGQGRLVGFLEASIRPFAEDCLTDFVGYLEGWYVEPEFRRTGIGRRLVAFAEQWAKAKGCSEMGSDAEIGNETSISAHLGLGYQITSRLVHFRKVLD